MHMLIDCDYQRQHTAIRLGSKSEADPFALSWIGNIINGQVARRTAWLSRSGTDPHAPNLLALVT